MSSHDACLYVYIHVDCQTVHSQSHWHSKLCTTSSHRVIDTANLVPRSVTEPLSQQPSYHAQSQSHLQNKPQITSSHWVIDTSKLVTRPVTKSLTQQISYHVKLHHHSSPVATSNQWCWSGVRGNINKLLFIVVMCSILLLHILWSGLQGSQIGFCLTGSISLWFS